MNAGLLVACFSFKRDEYQVGFVRTRPALEPLPYRQYRIL